MKLKLVIIFIFLLFVRIHWFHVSLSEHLNISVLRCFFVSFVLEFQLQRAPLPLFFLLFLSFSILLLLSLNLSLCLFLSHSFSNSFPLCVSVLLSSLPSSTLLLRTLLSSCSSLTNSLWVVNHLSAVPIHSQKVRFYDLRHLISLSLSLSFFLSLSISLAFSLSLSLGFYIYSLSLSCQPANFLPDSLLLSYAAFLCPRTTSISNPLIIP